MENKRIAFAVESLKKYPEFTTKARGWSMRPFIEHERDDLVFGRVERSPQVGDVLLCELAPQHYVCHRVVSVTGEELTLQGDGNVSGTEHCRIADVRAVLIRVRRKGRVYDLRTSRIWRAYSTVWMHITWMRRYLLFLYRIQKRLR